MPHIHTEENQHDLTVTSYIVRVDTPEPKALLHMHRKLNVLLPVGGHVELDETPWQAMAHELTEESGYTLSQLQILQPQSRIKKISNVVQHPYPLSMNTHEIPDGHYHTDIQYGFVTTEDPSVQINEGESSDLRWVTQKELSTLSSELIYEGTREIYTFMFDEALAKWDKVDTNDFLLSNE